MKIAIKSFTGGEVSGSLSARYDLDKYPSFLRHCENFVPELHGPLRKRMGTRFLEDLGTSPAILIPFQFSSDPTQNYALIFQEKIIRIAQRNGCISQEMEEKASQAEDNLEAKASGSSSVNTRDNTSFSSSKTDANPATASISGENAKENSGVNYDEGVSPSDNSGANHDANYDTSAVNLSSGVNTSGTGANNLKDNPDTGVNAKENPDANYDGLNKGLNYVLRASPTKASPTSTNSATLSISGVSPDTNSGDNTGVSSNNNPGVSPNNNSGDNTGENPGNNPYDDPNSGANLKNHVRVETPYLTEELYDISFSQSGDMVYLAHHNHPLMKLVRYGHRDWKLEEVLFMPTINSPEEFSVSWKGAGGSYPLRYEVAAVNKKGEVSKSVNAQANNGKHVNDWVVGEYTTLKWNPVKGAETYNVYRQEAGTYGLIGMTEETSFRDEKYRADTADTPSEPQNPFVEGNNPGVVCFHQQRLVLGAPYLEPQTWYASRTGNYEDFSKSRPVKDDDSLEYTIASGRIDNIQWMTSFGDLLIGTAGSEHKAVGADQGTLTPSSVNIREQSFWGSLRLRPLIIGNSIIHVQRQGSRVRDLFYSLEKDGYAGNDLSIMAPHLFDRFSIKQWDYQQAPGSLVWAVRNDGVMLVLVYMQEHDIWGWSRISTQGEFTSVVVNSGHLEDDVYCVVAREIKGEKRYFLERFENRWFKEDGVEKAFYLDSGLSYEGEKAVQKVYGLDHLEGCKVDILAHGSPVEPQLVKNGSVELPYPAKDIHIGLNFKAIMSPHVPEADTDQGTSYGRVRNYATSKISLLDSSGGKYGQSTKEDDLYKFDWVPEMWSEAVDPATGFRDFNLNTPFSEDGAFYIVQDEPLPFTVAALVLDVDFQA